MLKLFARKKETSAKEKASCLNCKFSKGSKFGNCWVGTYYASKGVNDFCFEGELWESETTLSENDLNLLEEMGQR